MLLAPIKARLLDQVPSIKLVYGAAQLADAIARQQFEADAYLVPRSIQPGPNGLVNAVSQRSVETIGVVTITKVYNDATGDRSLDAVETLRRAVIAALLNWVPADGYEPFIYGAGQLIGATPDAIAWADDFRSAVLERKTS